MYVCLLGCMHVCNLGYVATWAILQCFIDTSSNKRTAVLALAIPHLMHDSAAHDEAPSDQV